MVRPGRLILLLTVRVGVGGETTGFFVVARCAVVVVVVTTRVTVRWDSGFNSFVFKKFQARVSIFPQELQMRECHVSVDNESTVRSCTTGGRWLYKRIR